MEPVFKIRLFTLMLVGLAWLFIPGGNPSAASDSLRATHEYKVKAAFMYNFMIYTKWPDSAFKNQRSPIKINIYGPETLSEAFNPLVKKMIGRRKIVVAYKDAIDPNDAVHAAFFVKTKADLQHRELSTTKNLPILTVGETPGFTRHGGMINFVMAGKKIRFEINPSAAQQAGLKISSKLLNLATIVDK